jgi:hypothetical protein
VLCGKDRRLRKLVAVDTRSGLLEWPKTGKAEEWIERQGHRILDRMTWHEPVESWNQ